MDPTTEKSGKPFLLIALAIIIVLVAGGATFWALRHHKNNTGNNAISRQAIVQVDSTGFTPATLTVTLGTTIVWKNTDTSPHAIASNPYPANDSVPGLRSQNILPNGSYTYKPTATGTINYHDNLSPTHNGTIVVTK